MNDRHPAGDAFPADPGAEYSYAGYDTAHYEQSAYGSHGTTDYAAPTGGDGWSTGAYDTSGAAVYQTGFDTGGYEAGAYGTGAYDTGSYDTTGYGTGGYDAHAYGTDAYGTAAYETAGWESHGPAENPSSGLIPQQPGPHVAEQDWHTGEQGWPVPADGTAQWDVSAYATAGWDGSAYGQGHGHDVGDFATGAYATDPHGSDTYATDACPADSYGPAAHGTHGSDSGAHEGHGWTDGYATVTGTGDGPAFEEQPTAAYETFGSYETYPDQKSAEAETFAAEPFAGGESTSDPYASDPYAANTPPAEDAAGADGYAEPVLPRGSEAEPEPGAAVPGPQGRGRRRSPKPRRSALLTVAAPSVAVLGVAGIAAASVLPAGDEETAQAAPDTTEVKVSPANSKLDTQLAGLREAGDDFADRASRTQERIDLKKRQEAERRREAAEAARREALRPKFALPVEGYGISAYFGQAGINWMSVHTGLDFPVSYGTPVKAATDGTVRTQWNTAYGNMIIVTAPDGTETWYCHLSSTRIRSGSVKAGTTIGYSGNSGNSTGPHLHFEVRPGGGSAIDPLTWFRSHGLEPS